MIQEFRQAQHFVPQGCEAKNAVGPDRRRAVGHRGQILARPRRGGDAVKLVCGSTRAKAELSWHPGRSTMQQMIADAWRWHQNGTYQA